MIPSILSSVVSSPRKYLLEGEHSYVQVRGITYPKKCAFVAPHTIAIAGLDDCGNGCLLLASFGPPEIMIEGQNGSSHIGKESSLYNIKSTSSVIKGEARRIAYHRFFKRGKYDRDNNHNHHLHQNGNLDNNGDYHNGQQLKLTHIKNDPIDDDNDDDNHKDNNVQKENANYKKGEDDGITKKVEEMTFDEDEDFVSITADNGSGSNNNNNNNNNNNDISNDNDE